MFFVSEKAGKIVLVGLIKVGVVQLVAGSCMVVVARTQCI